MRQVTKTIYKFNELSEKGKQKAIQKWRETNWQTGDYAWQSENRESMEAFADIFPIKVTSWEYGGRGEGVNFHFTSDEDTIENLSGQRLATYLWNNYRDELYSKKCIGVSNLRLTDEKYRHNRVKSTQITNQCVNKGKWINFYYSAIQIEECCPLTGYAADDALCQPIWDFIRKPDSRSFKDLLEDCFAQWIKYCNDDIADQDSDEYIKDTIEANDYEFDEDGELQ